MNHHTTEVFQQGPLAGRWAYWCLSRRGSYVECGCQGEWSRLRKLDGGKPYSSPEWATATVGHATKDEALACMRAVLWARLRLDGETRDWRGCAAPAGDGICDVPTKRYADIPPSYFYEPLCDDHRTTAVVAAMWDGPGEWFGSW